MRVHAGSSDADADADEDAEAEAEAEAEEEVCLDRRWDLIIDYCPETRV